MKDDVLAAGGGAVLAFTSVTGENTMILCGSSKAATNHLIYTSAFDLASKEIRVNGMASGAMRTDALESGLNDEIESTMLAHTPIQRLGEPQGMANGADFCVRPLQAASMVRFSSYLVAVFRN